MIRENAFLITDPVLLEPWKTETCRGRSESAPRILSTATVLLGFAQAFLSGLAFAASFTGVGSFPDGEYPYSRVRGLSADGTVVVGESLSANGIEAFRWTATGGMEPLGDLGGSEFLSSAFSTSSEGSVVVGSSRSHASGSGAEAFRWVRSFGMAPLGDLPGGAFSSGASAVSLDGSAIAGTSFSSLAPSWGEAFRWTEGEGMSGLGTLPGASNPASVVNGISGDGSVIVGWSFSGNGREAFRWNSSEGMAPMGDLPGGLFDSVATAVSSDGNVVVGIGHGPGTTAFRWTASEGMTSLGNPPGGLLSEAWGVSSDGSIVVGSAGVDGHRVPTIWDESNGNRNLEEVLIALGLGPQIEGWNLDYAIAVSADGSVIVGRGRNPAGDTEGWVASLGPDPVAVPALSRPWLIAFAAILLLLAPLPHRRERR